jgi:membrane-associated phospholipid phosphatase
MRFLVVLSIAALGCHAQTDEDRDVSFKKLVPNILQDQKHIWSLPIRLAQGHDWIPTGATLAIGTGLVVGADPSTAHYFRKTTAFNGFNSVFSSTGTTVATLATPAVLYATGWARKDSKMTSTALFAAEALADSAIVTEVFKPAIGRVRPSALPQDGNFRDTWGEGGGRFSSAHNSFPSGHSISAFSVATVVSRRYGNHRWVPWVAYGAATAIGVSRITQSAHYVSDVFFGGVMGYSIARFSVLR